MNASEKDLICACAARLADFGDCASADGLRELVRQANARERATLRAPSDTQGEGSIGDDPDFLCSLQEYVDATALGHGKNFFVELVAYIDSRQSQAIQQSPDAVRDATLNAADRACVGELVDADLTHSEGDAAYNAAIGHCRAAISKLKSTAPKLAEAGKGE